MTIKWYMWVVLYFIKEQHTSDMYKGIETITYFKLFRGNIYVTAQYSQKIAKKQRWRDVKKQPLQSYRLT